MKTKSILTFIFFIFSPLLSISKQLSEESTISIITCGSGQEIYSTFGHSAIRIMDPKIEMDLVFNYGSFDFDDPQFYTKFIRGKLKYYLSLSDYKTFIHSYQQEKRAVSEQVLNIDTEQRNNIYKFLITNYRPENRYYLYDFFYDNCSTRELELLIKVLDKNLILPASIHQKTNKTFRDLIDPYLIPLPWADFGIDLGLGSKTDKITTNYQHSFLPDYLKNTLNEIKIKEGTTIKPLIEKENILYNPEEKLLPESSISPVTFFWSFFVILTIITFIGYRKNKYNKNIDFLIFTSTGLLGMLLFFLWFGTDHKATADNYNLIWALPTHFVFSLFLVIKPIRSIFKPYMLVTLISLFLLLLTWPFIIQKLHPSTIPIILILIIRSIFIYLNLNKIIGYVKSSTQMNEEKSITFVSNR